MNSINPRVHGIFDPITSTVTYVVDQGPGTVCAIIDPVLDFDAASGRTSTRSAEKVVRYVQDQALDVQWILETHAHADHLTAAPYLQTTLGGKIAIGDQIAVVQKVFASIFNLGSTFRSDGSQFDRLLRDGEELEIGALRGVVMAVPGHTPACIAYKIGDAVFVGDTIFMPDVGTARCDFPGGDAKTLYESIRRILSLPVDTRLFVCHDYPPKSRDMRFETTVAEQRRENIHVHDGIDEAQFVEMRTTRDATLAMPALILPAVQINVRAGRMPPQENNGIAYLKLPLNAL